MRSFKNIYLGMLKTEKHWHTHIIWLWKFQVGTTSYNLKGRNIPTYCKVTHIYNVKQIDK